MHSSSDFLSNLLVSLFRILNSGILRDIIADEEVVYFFEREIVQLRDMFREWAPKTSVSRDLKRKL